MPNDSEGSRIDTFLAAKSFAVVGASNNPMKYGNKVLKTYLAHDRKAFPVNPKEPEVLGLTSYKSLSELPEQVDSISIITPPAVTEQVVEDAIAAGAKHIWMQPGAESLKAIERAEEAGLTVISGGPCLMVVMGYHE
ncbi:MAG: CoA-binding protein [Leptolyngbya sp.]|nr:CoA-binding protein [Candidatus Melainabacteria bacterium]